MTVDELIDEIVEREGGFVNNPLDRGGPTRYGITQVTLARWRGAPVTVEDVRTLELGEARDIYRSEYVIQPGFALLPEPLRAHVVDFGVNAGPAQAVKTLQRVLGVKADGIMGPVTRHALQIVFDSGGVERLTRRFWQERVRFYIHLVGVRPNQLEFADGWLNRCFAMQP
jgi:lysozyme family protein